MEVPSTLQTPTLSYWELREFFTSVDLTIVGSGIVGLTTSIYYKKKYPKRKVLILERGMLPSGASTKNAGFACFGSVSELKSDLEKLSEDELFALIALRYNGLEQLKKLLGEKSIGFEASGGFEIFKEADEALYTECMDMLPSLNRRMHSELGLKECYQDSSNKIESFGFSGVNRMILNQHEGAIDTGKMMANLIQLTRDLGVIILNGTELKSWSDNDSYVDLFMSNDVSVSTGQLHFATNGFAKELLPELDVQPARAQVLITEKIPSLKVKGTFHLDEGFYYFRDVDDRILLGGGRNLALNQENSSELELTDLIQTKLNEVLDSIITPHDKVKVEHRWAGVMGVGATKQIITKRLSERTTCAVRLGGMGIAVGSSVGKLSAQLISE